jgi:hypothetical protein
MWSYLKTRSFINPLPRYVENKAGFAKALRLDEMTLVLVRFAHVASFIVNANQRIV